MGELYHYEFHSLEGVKGGKLKGPASRSVNGFKRAMTNGRLCSAAGDHGAVTVWLDDEGLWRCVFQRFMRDIDRARFGTKAEVYRWLVEWLPRMHELHAIQPKASPHV